MCFAVVKMLGHAVLPYRAVSVYVRVHMYVRIIKVFSTLHYLCCLFHL